jgi:hypothetical protein
LVFSENTNTKIKDAGINERAKRQRKDAGNRECDCHDLLLANLAMTEGGENGLQ